MLTALKSSLKHRCKHILRLPRLYGSQGLVLEIRKAGKINENLSMSYENLKVHAIFF